MKKKHVITIIAAVLAVALAGTVGFILFKNYNNQKVREKNNSIASSYVKRDAQDGTQNGKTQSGSDKSRGGSNQKATEKLPENPVNYKSLRKINPDIYAWINVPGTSVDYAVLQSPTNDLFYLDHDVDGEYAFAGSIYSQLCNRRDFHDRVTVLYGHNMLDGSMFATLHRFEDKSFFDSHSSFNIVTKDASLDYTIISAFEYDDRHIMNSYNFSDDKAYQAFIDEVIKPRSMMTNVRKGETLTTDDKIVVLSTCLNAGEGRYLVVGKLKNETKLQTQT